MQTFEEFSSYILKHSRHNEVPSTKVHIIIDYPKIQWDSWAEYMATLTWFSGIPLSKGGSKNSHVIFAKDIDQALTQADQYQHAMVSYIGSFYYSDHEENIHKHFEEFCQSNNACKGHLLFHPNKQYGRLHPQTILVNLDHWRKIGRPSFGYYTGEVVNYIRSISNVHDDYTPHWVKSGVGKKTVTLSEQAEYISRVLEDGQTILNFDKERRVKFFCYPERRYSEALENERNRSSNIVYVKNNETITSLKSNVKKFDVIYAPASGYTSEYLLHTFGHNDTKLVIYDYNKDSLRWKQMVYEMATSEKDLELIAEHFRKKGCIVDDCSYKKDLVAENESNFPISKFLKTVAGTTPTFKHHDVVEKCLEVDPTKRNFIYLSNIFSYNFIIHRFTVEEIHNKFLEYCNLPNTTVYGKNVFKDTVYHENHSS